MLEAFDLLGSLHSKRVMDLERWSRTAPAFMHTTTSTESYLDVFQIKV